MHSFLPKKWQKISILHFKNPGRCFGLAGNISIPPPRKFHKSRLWSIKIMYIFFQEPKVIFSFWFGNFLWIYCCSCVSVGKGKDFYLSFILKILKVDYIMNWFEFDLSLSFFVVNKSFLHILCSHMDKF